MVAEASIPRRRLPEAPIVPVAVPDPLLYLFGHPLAPDRTAAKRIFSRLGFLQPLFFSPRIALTSCLCYSGGVD